SLPFRPLRGTGDVVALQRLDIAPAFLAHAQRERAAAQREIGSVEIGAGDEMRSRTGAGKNGMSPQAVQLVGRQGQLDLELAAGGRDGRDHTKGYSESVVPSQLQML